MMHIHRLMLNPLDIRDAMIADRPKAVVSWPVHHDRIPSTGPDARPQDTSEECFSEVDWESFMEDTRQLG